MVADQSISQLERSMGQHLCIERILNFPIDSNCYIVTTNNFPECIVVDPALENASTFYQNLRSRNLRVKYIILTHEHFDHISSIEYLRKESGCEVISTLPCSESITNPKKNLSLFHDQVGFICTPSDILITVSGFMLHWSSYTLGFYLTPGHSEGSLSFSIGNYLFTGDTIIKNKKTIVKLPGGSLEKLKKSLVLLFDKFNNDTIICPGHGEMFNLSQTNAYSIIGKK